MISCGYNFTVCVDHEGFIWSFGYNYFGQLGTGNQLSVAIPQKLFNIPPVLSVSCGDSHTLIITNDSNLWSCGRNIDGQLCLGDEEYRLKPQKTSFSNISKISAGWYHSLFQNNKGEIFSCGNNEYGQCGLGHFNDPQIVPSLIPNAPSNIIEFVCGGNHSLFLDSEGNVYSVGFNGNLWSFGKNDFGQLGNGDETDINTPILINSLKNIRQISYGCCGEHFFVKNSQNQIFVTARNNYGQLGTGDTESVSIPKEIDSQYSAIWRDEFYTRAKSARK